MIHLILSILIAFPAWSGDYRETVIERSDRLEMVATAIARASHNREELAALIAVGYYESRYARLVQLGQCSEMPKGQQCDHGRARSPWQLWEGSCPALWLMPQGTQPWLDEAAKCAVRHLRRGVNMCEGWGPAFGHYAGRGCKWPGSFKRERLRVAVLQKLHQ